MEENKIIDAEFSEAVVNQSEETTFKPEEVVEPSEEVVEPEVVETIEEKTE